MWLSKWKSWNSSAGKLTKPLMTMMPSMMAGLLCSTTSASGWRAFLQVWAPLLPWLAPEAPTCFWGMLTEFQKLTNLKVFKLTADVRQLELNPLWSLKTLLPQPHDGCNFNRQQIFSNLSQSQGFMQIWNSQVQITKTQQFNGTRRNVHLS